jgi:hypothetical protein
MSRVALPLALEKILRGPVAVRLPLPNDDESFGACDELGRGDMRPDRFAELAVFGRDCLLNAVLIGRLHSLTVKVGERQAPDDSSGAEKQPSA